MIEILVTRLARETCFMSHFASRVYILTHSMVHARARIGTPHVVVYACARVVSNDVIINLCRSFSSHLAKQHIDNRVGPSENMKPVNSDEMMKLMKTLIVLKAFL